MTKKLLWNKSFGHQLIKEPQPCEVLTENKVDMTWEVDKDIIPPMAM